MRTPVAASPRPARRDDAYAGPMLTAGTRLRGHPMVADGVLAVLLFAVSADQWPASLTLATAAAVLVSALLAATVLLRRRYPVAAFAAAMTIAAAQVLFRMQAGGGGPAGPAPGAPPPPRVLPR